jgi:hypothetical protein
MKQEKFLVVLSSFCVVFLLLFCASCHKTTTSQLQRPVINSFGATPSSIDSGSASTLSWNIVGATTISINNGVGDVSAVTSKVVSPTQTTTYIITATNSNGTATAQVTVIVNPLHSILLFYGGDPLDAPTLGAGTYEAAARFTPVKIGNLVGKTIKEIHYYLSEKPDSVWVKLYGPLNETTPGNLLYSADVTSAAGSQKWNIHTLTQPITLKSEDLWLSIEFKLTGSRKAIGCDPGPALPDGDWLFSSSDGKWTPFNQRSGVSINWTIRLNVAL